MEEFYSFMVVPSTFFSANNGSLFHSLPPLGPSTMDEHFYVSSPLSMGEVIITTTAVIYGRKSH